MLSVRNLLMSSKFCTGSTIPGSGCAFSKPWQSSNSKITPQENEKLDPDQAPKTVYVALYSEDQKKKKKTHLTYFLVLALSTFGVLFNPTNFSLSVDYFC